MILAQVNLKSSLLIICKDDKRSTPLIREHREDGWIMNLKTFLGSKSSSIRDRISLISLPNYSEVILAESVEDWSLAIKLSKLNKKRN